MTASTPTRIGGTPTGRNALTESQLNLVISAAHTALTGCDEEISPSRVAKVVRRFGVALKRSRLTFHEFLSDSANQIRYVGGDPELTRVIAYLDRTGENAVNRVMRQRGW